MKSTHSLGFVNRKSLITTCYLLFSFTVLSTPLKASDSTSTAVDGNGLLTLGYVWTDIIYYNFNTVLEWKPKGSTFSYYVGGGSGIRYNELSDNNTSINKHRLEVGTRKYFAPISNTHRYFLQASGQFVDSRAYFDDSVERLLTNEQGQMYYDMVDFQNRYDFHQYGLNVGIGRRDYSKYYFLDLSMAVGYRWSTVGDVDFRENLDYLGSSGYNGLLLRFTAVVGFKWDYW